MSRLEGSRVKIIGSLEPVFVVKEVIETQNGYGVIVVNPKTSDQHELTYSDLEVLDPIEEEPEEEEKKPETIMIDDMEQYVLEGTR